MCSGLRANSKNAEKYKNKTLKWKNMIQLFHDPRPQKSIKIIFWHPVNKQRNREQTKKKIFLWARKSQNVETGRKNQINKLRGHKNITSFLHPFFKGLLLVFFPPTTQDWHWNASLIHFIRKLSDENKHKTGEIFIFPLRFDRDKVVCEWVKKPTIEYKTHQ